MSILLTHKINTGDLDTAGEYKELKLIQQTLDDKKKILRLVLEYGNTVDGKWVPSELGQVSTFLVKNRRERVKHELLDEKPIQSTIREEKRDYDNLMNKILSKDTSVRSALSKIIYEYLIEEGLVEGTII